MVVRITKSNYFSQYLGLRYLEISVVFGNRKRFTPDLLANRQDKTILDFIICFIMFEGFLSIQKEI